jgi:hypothetical protein
MIAEEEMSVNLNGLAATTDVAASAAAAPATAPAPPTPVGTLADSASQMIVSTTVTEISPPGYTQTVTTRADGVVTTTITNEVGAVVSTTTSHTAAVGTQSGVSASASGVSVWA